MDEPADPRLAFALRLRELQKAVGLSIRDLVRESNHTPRRQGEPRFELKRATIVGMVHLTRPVRPGPDNFEVFVDTCLRIAAEQHLALPAGLDDRQAWDRAYWQLRGHVGRYPSRSGEHPSDPQLTQGAERPAVAEGPVDDAAHALTAAPPAFLDSLTKTRRAFPTRRQILLAAPLALAGVAVPLLLRRTSGAPTTGASPSADTGSPLDDRGYNPAGTLLSPPIAPDTPVWSVAIGLLQGQPVIAVGRADGTVQLWDPVTRAARSIPLTGHHKPVYSIALNPPTALSASVDGTLRAWDLTADPPTSTQVGDSIAGSINAVAVGTVNGAPVAVSACDDHTVRVWNPASPKTVSTILGSRLDAEVTSIAAGTLNGTMVAVSGSGDGTIRLWDVQAQRAVQVLGSHHAAVWAMAVGQVNGRTIAVSGSEDGEVRMWDLAAPVPGGRTLSRIKVAVKSIAIGTVNGRAVAICSSDDAEIRFWNLSTAQQYGGGLEGPETAAESIALGNIGGRPFLVSGHWDGTIWTWSL